MELLGSMESLPSITKAVPQQMSEHVGVASTAGAEQGHTDHKMFHVAGVDDVRRAGKGRERADSG
jgi:hypothetical protein